MKNTLVHTAVAALVLATPFVASQASAKVMGARHHFVQSQPEDYPVMEMKYQRGRWTWINSTKTFMPRVKLQFSSRTGIDRAKLYVDHGKFGLWVLPIGVTATNYENVVTVRIGKTVLGRQLAQARSLCHSSGGSGKVVRDLTVDTTFYTANSHGNGPATEHAASRSTLTMRVICHAKGPDENRESFGQSAFRFLAKKVGFRTGS